MADLEDMLYEAEGRPTGKKQHNSLSPSRWSEKGSYSATREPSSASLVPLKKSLDLAQRDDGHGREDDEEDDDVADRYDDHDGDSDGDSFDSDLHIDDRKRLDRMSELDREYILESRYYKRADKDMKINMEKKKEKSNLARKITSPPRTVSSTACSVDRTYAKEYALNKLRNQKRLLQQDQESHWKHRGGDTVVKQRSFASVAALSASSPSDAEDESSTGEMGDSEDDSFDSDLYIDENDRKRLDRLSELDREYIVESRSYKRADKDMKINMEKKKEKSNLTRKNTSPPHTVNRAVCSSARSADRTYAKEIVLNKLLNQRRLRQQDQESHWKRRGDDTAVKRRSFAEPAALMASSSCDAEDESSTGEMSDSEDDSFDSDLYIDENDRKRLARMSDLDRVYIVESRKTKRADKDMKINMEKKKEKSNLTRKDTSPPHTVNRAVRASANSAYRTYAKKYVLNELCNQKRLRQQNQESYWKRRDADTTLKQRSFAAPATLSASSHSDAEDENSTGEMGDSDDDKVSKDSSVLTYEDVKGITISRSKLAKLFMEPFFEKLIVGCFVRVGIGKSKTGPIYCLCIVRNVDAADLNRQYKLGNKMTHKYLNVVWGNENSVARWQMEMISDSPPIKEEFDQLIQEIDRHGGRMPSKQEVLDKRDAIEKSCSYVYSAETVKQMLHEKKSTIRRPLNVAAEKDRLSRALEVARQKQDEVKVKKIKAKLQELEASRQTQQKDMQINMKKKKQNCNLTRKDTSPPHTVNWAVGSSAHSAVKEFALDELHNKKRLRQQNQESHWKHRDADTAVKQRSFAAPAASSALSPSDSEDENSTGEMGDSDDDKESKDSSVLTYEDVKGITISRSKLAKLFMEPFFEELIVGCFVRVGVGKSKTGPIYCLCIVRNVDAADLNRQYKLGNKMTNKYLNVVWGNDNSVARWQMEMISDSPPIKEEFDHLIQEVDRYGGRMPSKQGVLDKQDAIEKSMCTLQNP